MRNARRCRTLVRGAVSTVVCLCLSVGVAVAQCVMCGKNAEYAAGASGQAYATLAMGALVLLVPVLSMLGGVAALLWKHRR